MDKGVLSQWQRGEGERQEGASERGRERVEVGASLSFAGDEGFYGGGGTQARASLFLSLSLSLSLHPVALLVKFRNATPDRTRPTEDDPPASLSSLNEGGRVK